MELYSQSRKPGFWAIGVILVGIIGLSGWIIQARALITIFPEGVTMAPVSAFLFIVLGICMILAQWEKKDSTYTLVKNVLLIIPLLTGAWVLIDTITGHPAHIDWSVHPPDTIFWMAPESSISPVSALLFLGLVCGIFGYHTWARLTSLISLILLVTSGVLVLGYLAGSPVFYGGDFKPVSFLSACGFLLAGAGLLAGIRKDRRNEGEGDPSRVFG